MLRCPSCGAELPNTEPSCPSCKSSTISVHHDVALDAARLAPVCACCLAPDTIAAQETQSFTIFGGERYVSMSIPKCTACGSKSKRLMKLASWIGFAGMVGGFFLSHMVVFPAAKHISMEDPYKAPKAWILTLVIALVAGCIGYFVLSNRARRVGHTRHCDPITFPRSGEGKLRFHNRAYAEMCKRLSS